MPKKRRREDEAIGRSRGGLSTKIHTLVDALGNPVGFLLTGGQAHDLEGADHFLPSMQADTLIADKAFDADAADAAIRTTLMVRTAFKLALRQTEGLLASVITLMDLRISVLYHTTISGRAVTLPVIQADLVPHDPLHLLIDSTGLQVYGRVNGWRRNTARSRVANGANSICRSMLAVA